MLTDYFTHVVCLSLPSEVRSAVSFYRERADLVGCKFQSLTCGVCMRLDVLMAVQEVGTGSSDSKMTRTLCKQT